MKRRRAPEHALLGAELAALADALERAEHACAAV